MTFTTNQIGLKSSYGYIWMNTANFTGVNFNFTTSYQQLTSLGTNFTLASPSQDFAMTTDGQLKYTGLTTKLFSIDGQCTIGGAGVNTMIQLYKNGSPVTGSEVPQTTFHRCMLCGFPILLSTNDYLSLYVKTSTNVTRAILQVNLSAEFMGGF